MAQESNTTLKSEDFQRKPITFELDQPVEFPEFKTLTELTIKPFTGWDVVECGIPFSNKRDRHGNVSELVDPEACMRLISKMAGVPIGMIRKLAIVDFMTAVEAMKIFFYYKSPKTSSINTSPSENGLATATSSSA